MNDQELNAWLALHGGEVARQNNEKTRNVLDEATGKPLSQETYIDSTTIVARDGAKIEVRRQAPSDNPEGGVGPVRAAYEVVGTTPPREGTTQTPEQQQGTVLENARRQQEIQAANDKRDQEIRDNNERSYNQQVTGFAETHAERAARELRQAQEQRAVNQENTRIAAQQQSNQIAAGNLTVSQGQLAETIRQHQFDESKPSFLSQADDKTPNIVRYNPTTGQTESIPNPNYDAVKAQAEQLRQNLATQIQAGTLQLDQAKQQYTEWFDQNVKTPLALAQEARDRAAEQRAALDAEERRRQFASTFSLQRGQLGEQAGQAAMQAEESLLPYRAGPDEAADMSSAINGLGAGGDMNTNAAAGIHFKASDFQFNAPDFKSIARDAAAQALKGISSYVPSSQQYSTADYSGVPSANTSGAPSVPDVSSGIQTAISSLGSKYQYSGANAGAAAPAQ